MDFDFNLILVPAVLTLLGLILLDKFVLKQRETQGKGNESFFIGLAYDFFPVLAIVLLLRAFLYEPFNIPSESMKPGLKIGDFILVNKYEYGLRLPLTNTKIIGNNDPQRGDVVVFRYPNHENDPKKQGQSYIKRVIGLPGDRIEMRQGQLIVNGQVFEKTAVEDITIDFQVYDEHKNKINILTDAQLYNEVIADQPHTIQQVSSKQSSLHAKILVENYPGIGLTEGQSFVINVPEGQYFMMGDNRDQSADSREWGFVPEQNLIGKAIYIWMHKEPGFHLPTFNRNGSIQ